MEAIEEAIAGLLAAPVWAQAIMVLFAAAVVWSFVGPMLRKRRFRRRFAAIAHALGTQPKGKDWPFTFAHDLGSRAFTLTYDVRTTRKGQTYRGPTGHLLTICTPLRWSGGSMHQVDVTKLGGRLSRWTNRGRPTGDPEFDARFSVIEEGLPVREGWLNADTRRALASSFDSAPLTGTLWIREGVLHNIMDDAWARLDGPMVKRLLGQQADLAQALERAASR